MFEYLGLDATLDNFHFRGDMAFPMDRAKACRGLFRTLKVR